MEQEFDTGVEETQAAAVSGEETEDSGENTPFEYEDEPEAISLAELMDEEDTEKVEKPGDDNPPKESGAEATQETPKEPAPALDGVETAKAFATRLSQEKRKLEQQIRAELEKKYAPAKEAEIELAARKLIEANPKMEMSLDMAKMIVRAQQPAAQQPEQQPEVTAESEAEARKEAWKQKLIDEEPLLKVALNDPNATVLGHAAKDPVFKKVLSTGLSPIEAHTLAKDLREIFNKEISAAKADGQKDVIQKLKDSNARATTPVSSVKSTGKARTMDDYIKNAPIEELNEILQRGGKVYVG